jgi:hypothetical protein
MRKLQRVVHFTLEGAPILHLAAQFGGGLAGALRRLRIVPEARLGDLIFVLG